MNAESRASLALFFTPGLGPVKIKLLLEHFGHAEDAVSANLTKLREVQGLDSSSMAEIGGAKTLERADQELERAGKMGLEVVGLSSPVYPEALRAIYDPPPVLWVRGDVSRLEELRGPTPRSIGIVGTRTCSNFARAFTAEIAKDLSQSGVSIISGLARGIDTAAHKAAIDANGSSIGVLGCGADRIYPPENAKLSEGLTVISGYPVGTPPAAHNFPARNRIIAGLSSGVIVVEGDVKSGSLITAVAALEAGRTIFAVPGRPGDPNARGPNRLLRDGAVLTESANDVLEELRWGIRNAETRELPKLEGNEAKVFAALEHVGTDGMLLDGIVAASGLNASEATGTLMMLSFQNLVLELPGGRWTRI
jgi:DNA processing protein